MSAAYEVAFAAGEADGGDTGEADDAAALATAGDVALLAPGEDFSPAARGEQLLRLPPPYIACRLAKLEPCGMRRAERAGCWARLSPQWQSRRSGRV